MERTLRGRFAPSPSGRMHLGNLFTALLAWLSVRAAGGTMVLRMEDLDPERCREEYARVLADDSANGAAALIRALGRMSRADYQFRLALETRI